MRSGDKWITAFPQAAIIVRRRLQPTYFGVENRSYHGLKDHQAQSGGDSQLQNVGAITVFATAMAGIPMSTIHTITDAIVGVGATQRLSAVRWGEATRIVWAWIFIIPASALAAAVLIRS